MQMHILLKLKKPNKASLFKRFLYELVIAFSFLTKTLKVVKKDSIVFTGTTPILLLFVLFIIKKFLNFKWILLVHDVFPENLAAAKILKNDHFLFKILKSLFDRIYASADEVIVIGKDMKELVHQKTNQNNNITVVQNWIDSSDIGTELKTDNRILKRIELA